MRGDTMDVELRVFKESDADSFYKYSSNANVRKNMRDGFPSSTEQCKELVKSFVDNEGTIQSVRAIVINEEVVGCIGLFFSDDNTAEIAYWLGEPYWRKGIMSTGIQKFCEYAFPRYKLKKIFARPFFSNAASRKVLDKAGFQYAQTVEKGIYKDGEMIDYCEYALDADQPEII